MGGSAPASEPDVCAIERFEASAAGLPAICQRAERALLAACTSTSRELCLLVGSTGKLRDGATGERTAREERTLKLERRSGARSGWRITERTHSLNGSAPPGCPSITLRRRTASRGSLACAVRTSNESFAAKAAVTSPTGWMWMLLAACGLPCIWKKMCSSITLAVAGSTRKRTPGPAQGSLVAKCVSRGSRRVARDTARARARARRAPP